MIPDVSKVDFAASSRLFLDANVWMAVFAPPSDHQGCWQALYSKMLKRIKRASADIYIDSTVISEYLNSYARTEFNVRYADTLKIKFKDFRDGHRSEYKPIAAQAAKNVKDILSFPQIHVVDCNVSHFDIEVMLTDFEVGATDWNDQVIVEVCKEGKYDLITNDKDFKDVEGLKILTHNSSLLGKVCICD